MSTALDAVITADVDEKSDQPEKQPPPLIPAADTSPEKDPDSPFTLFRPSLNASNLEHSFHETDCETIFGEVWEKVKRESFSEGTATVKMSPIGPVSVVAEVEEANGRAVNGNGNVDGTNQAMMLEAWERLKKAYIYFKGKPVGTIAALDPSSDALNYNQVFVRDLFPTGLDYLMKSPPEPEIVKNFLIKSIRIQGAYMKRVDQFTLAPGVMLASFCITREANNQEEKISVDFGDLAIGRVAPVDSGFWWIILLRSYTKCTRDYSLQDRPELQRGLKLIVNLCLSDGFDTFPTLLCADGCSMIDRIMGMYGSPIEFQALFFFGLRSARQMLKTEHGGKELIENIEKRITALSYHIRKYYWLDFTQLNNIYRYSTEEFTHTETAVNKFNVIPDSIPDWVSEFMPLRGRCFIGNVSPARMDFCWFLIGNSIALLSSLATPEQATAIMDIIEGRMEDLIGEMPLKICYPALEGHEWKIVTGCDSKNTCWSYHNGGSWPVSCSGESVNKSKQGGQMASLKRKDAPNAPDSMPSSKRNRTAGSDVNCDSEQKKDEVPFDQPNYFEVIVIKLSNQLPIPAETGYLNFPAEEGNLHITTEINGPEVMQYSLFPEDDIFLLEGRWVDFFEHFNVRIYDKIRFNRYALNSYNVVYISMPRFIEENILYEHTITEENVESPILVINDEFITEVFPGLLEIAPDQIVKFTNMLNTDWFLRVTYIDELDQVRVSEWETMRLNQGLELGDRIRIYAPEFPTHYFHFLVLFVRGEDHED